MEVLWQRAPMSVKDVTSALSARSLAYTTVMTTLDRLHKKGLLDRDKQGHAFLYRPAMDRITYERRLIAGLLGDLPMASREALLSGFLDYAATDSAALDTLERLIAERKQEQP
jgi:predicted transcriptional regulator